YFAPVMSEFEIPGLTKTTVAASSQYVLMSRSHRLAYRNTVSLKELDGESFVLYPRTKESSIRDFQLCNLKASGITYKVYESETSPLFYKLLVPIGKGLILSPRDMMDLPPNTVCVSVTDVPHPAAPCFFYDRALLNEETEAFVRDYVIFAKEAHRREHRAAL
ncbi:MAG: LysR substrate-binding domain-containing protein, partial [Oscillospiraceae bacterium]